MGNPTVFIYNHASTDCVGPRAELLVEEQQNRTWLAPAVIRELHQNLLKSVALSSLIRSFLQFSLR